MITGSIGQTQKELGTRNRIIYNMQNGAVDNESLENKNETMKEECSMICAQKQNDKIETALKGLNFAGIKFHVIRQNP